MLNILCMHTFKYCTKKELQTFSALFINHSYHHLIWLPLGSHTLSICSSVNLLPQCIAYTPEAQEERIQNTMQGS